MTKKLLSHVIDERYSHRERIQIDGIVLSLFGVLLIMLFSFIYACLIVMNLMGEWGILVISLFVLALSKKVVGFFSLIILKKNKILRT